MTLVTLAVAACKCYAAGCVMDCGFMGSGYTGAMPAETMPPLQTAPAPKLRLGQKIALALVPPLAAVVIRLLGMTLRYEDYTEPGVTPGYKIPGPVVYAFWHRS